MSDLVAKALTFLPAEAAHRTALMGLKAGFGPKALGAPDPVLRTAIAGIELDHPVGLAAGFDKNAEAPDALLRAVFPLSRSVPSRRGLRLEIPSRACSAFARTARSLTAWASTTKAWMR